MGYDASGPQMHQVQRQNQDTFQDVVNSVVSEDALTALERDVMKRTRQANMALLKQKRTNAVDNLVVVSFNLQCYCSKKLQA